MEVTLGPPEPSLAPIVDKYRRRGANDDCRPFGSANLGAWSLHTRGPITSQTRIAALLGALRQLPAPWADHLCPAPVDSRDALESELTAPTREYFAYRVIGHLALRHGGVCRTADVVEAGADVTALLTWLGRRPHLYTSSQLFRVGRCWSYAYLGVATGRFALALFLQTD